LEKHHHLPFELSYASVPVVSKILLMTYHQTNPGTLFGPALPTIQDGNSLSKILLNTFVVPDISTIFAISL